jgi:transcription elongation GreA/GreB family factor
MNIALKPQILTHLKEMIATRMQVAWDAMQAAQASANEEGKSSAGDKYETARAMGQIERDMHARQYENNRQESLVLERIDSTLSFPKIGIGALVTTADHYIFVSISAGIITIEGKKIIAVSSHSPIGNALLGKQVGDSFLFQNKRCEILSIQ